MTERPSWRPGLEEKNFHLTSNLYSVTHERQWWSRNGSAALAARLRGTLAPRGCSLFPWTERPAGPFPPLSPALAERTASTHSAGARIARHHTRLRLEGPVTEIRSGNEM
ncbi:uncharacterized protein LOC126931711 [Macaca thibetana thibetana]|uniref:uncharacterized protein LOC126931711 n=1 Tax=Macaca thibetana thibetana TaxID=257877 RepID=UPI0021BCAE9C|nr:uncharacterized protein LOC126931711 [Macaca thibetana thibetana]